MGIATTRGFVPSIIALTLVGGTALVAGCPKKEEPRSERSATSGERGAANTPPNTTTNAQGTATAKADPCAAAEPKHGQVWFEDDYAAALACARASHKPLFVDLWAPWCHTCISMQEYVFPDPGLATMKDRFVWVAIDTDKQINAAVQEKLPPEVWPTFYVVAPEDESVHGRYLGAAPVGQLRDFLEQSENSYVLARGGDMPIDSPVHLLLDADRANVRGDLAAATQAYRLALDKAPADWPMRSGVLVSLAAVMARNQDWDGCARLAEKAMDQTGRSANVTDFVYRVSQCAGQLEPTRATSLREQAAKRLAALLEDPNALLSVDDRSDAMANLRELYLALDRKPLADALAKAQRVLLDKAAADAPNPWVAMTYNWPRAEVYVYLGKGLELVPVLQKSTADLPNEYDPPYRLAWVYLNSGQPESALEPALHALSLVYGPRKGRVHTVVADIYKALGDVDNERKARQAVVDLYANLPPGQRSPANLEAAKAALAAMDEASTATPE